MRYYPTFLLLLALLSPLTSLTAQWTPLSTGVSADLHTVERINDSTVYAAGQNVFIKSTDGGQSWMAFPFVNTNNQPIFNAVIEDLHFFTPDTGLAVGALANIFQIILRTTDGGQHWTLVVNGTNGSGWPGGFRKVFFIDPKNGWCTGSEGRLMRTTDGGLTWTQLAAATLAPYTYLHDVHFLNTQLGFLVAEIRYNNGGSGFYLKTTDGGQSWNVLLSSSPPYTECFFVNAQRGYLAQDGNLFRVNDGLIDFSYASFADLQPALEFQFFNADTGYALAGNSIRKTTAGGQFWETSDLPPAAASDMLDFDWSANGDTGYVVGKNGKAYKTTNGGFPYRPMAFFSLEPNGGFCPNAPVNCLNAAPEGIYNVQWLVDGALYATTNDLNISFPDYGGTHTIALVLDNGSTTDTFSQTITLEEKLPDFDIQLEWTTPPPLCASNSLELKVTNPVLQQSYFLYVNDQYYSQQLALSTDPILFSTPPIFDTSLIRVEVPLYSVCESKTIFSTLQADVIPRPDPDLAWQPSATKICVGQSADVTIQQSEANMQYQVFWNTVPVSSVVPGTGGNLLITTDSLFNSGHYEIEASFQGMCTRRLNQTVFIEIEYFYDQLDTSQAFAFAGVPVQLINPAPPELGTVLWNFGAQASPQQSTEFEPTVLFSNPGSYPFTYQYHSTGVCSGTKSGHFEVFGAADDLPGLFCPPKDLDKLSWENPQARHAVLDTKTDREGNIIVTGAIHQPIAWWHTMNLFVRKYDPTGVLLWEKNTDPYSTSHGINYRSSYGTAIATDPEGNIYLAGSYAADKAVLLGQTFTTTLSSNYSTGQGFIVKLNAKGAVLWTIRLNAQENSQFCVPSDLIYSEIDGHLHVALQGKSWIAELPAGGIVSDNQPDAQMWYLELDPEGFYVDHAQLGHISAGVGFWQYWHPPIGPSSYGYLYTFIAPEIRETPDGHLVFTNTFTAFEPSANLTFGAHTVNPLNKADATNNNYFVAVYNRNSHAWDNAFCAHSVSNWGGSPWRVQCTTTQDNAIVTGFGLVDEYFSYQFASLILDSIYVAPNMLVSTRNRSFLNKFDLSGNLLWNKTGSQQYVHTLETDPSGNIWMLSGYTGAAGFFEAGGSRPGIAALGGKDVLLSQFDPDGNIVGLHSFATANFDQATGLTIDRYNRVSVIASTDLNIYYTSDPAHNHTLFPYTPGNSCVPPVSVQETSRPLACQINPNPFSEFFQLSLDEPGSERFQLSLFDTQGRLVFAQVLTPDARGQIVVTPHILPGAYMVQILGAKGVFIDRVIKIKY